MPGPSSKKKRSNKQTAATAAPIITQPPPTTHEAINFAFFIEHADFDDIKRFLQAALLLPNSGNLKLLWQRAFTEGQKAGVTEGHSIGYEYGYDQGYLDASSDAIQDRENPRDIFGQEIKHVEISTQTDPILELAPSPAERQDPIPPPSLVTEPPPLNWADDEAPQLPSMFPNSKPRKPPRDLTCLRSVDPTPFPFSSLKHRSQRAHPASSRGPRQSHYQCRLPLSTPNALYRPPFRCSRQKLTKPPNFHIPSPTQICPPDKLDWETDPRLHDLSTALKALGWTRPT